jgi:adenosylcobyric acid synthase
MGFARAADVPVVVIGDIDRGGVIAQIVGTQAVLDPGDAALVVGFVVNKFRGDAALFRPGMDFISERTGWAGLGLVRHFGDAGRLPAEDAVVLDRPSAGGGGAFTVAVPRLAHIANFDDFDALRLESALRVVMVAPGAALPGDAELVILPGSKATVSDMEDFRRNGWDIDLAAHVRRGGRVLGLCGGYQMLGQRVIDANGIEGHPASVTGLGLLDVQTTLTPEKSLVEVEGVSVADGVRFRGYEMHIGRTSGPDCARPLLRFADGRVDGAVSGNGLVRGTYVHGLFADDAQRGALLGWIGAGPSGVGYEGEVERVLDRLGGHLADSVDLDALVRLAR